VCVWSLYGTAVPFRANGLGGRTRPYRLTRVRAHTCARAGPVLLRYKLDLVRTAWSSVAEHVAPYHAPTLPSTLPRSSRTDTVAVVHVSVCPSCDCVVRASSPQGEHRRIGGQVQHLHVLQLSPRGIRAGEAQPPDVGTLRDFGALRRVATALVRVGPSARATGLRVGVGPECAIL